MNNDDLSIAVRDIQSDIKTILKNQGKQSSFVTWKALFGYTATLVGISFAIIRVL